MYDLGGYVPRNVSQGTRRYYQGIRGLSYGTCRIQEGYQTGIKGMRGPRPCQASRGALRAAFFQWKVQIRIWVTLSHNENGEPPRPICGWEPMSAVGEQEPTSLRSVVAIRISCHSTHSRFDVVSSRTFEKSEIAPESSRYLSCPESCRSHCRLRLTAN